MAKTRQPGLSPKSAAFVLREVRIRRFLSRGTVVGKSPIATAFVCGEESSCFPNPNGYIPVCLSSQVCELCRLDQCFLTSNPGGRQDFDRAAF